MLRFAIRNQQRSSVTMCCGATAKFRHGIGQYFYLDTWRQAPGSLVQTISTT